MSLASLTLLLLTIARERTVRYFRGGFSLGEPDQNNQAARGAELTALGQERMRANRSRNINWTISPIWGIALVWLFFATPCRSQSAPTQRADEAADANGSVSVVTPSPAPIEGPAAEAVVPAALPAPASSAVSVAPADAGSSGGDWHLSVSPYLWFPGVHGGVGIGGREASIHASAGDLLSNFRFGLMGVVEPRYKKVILPLDIMWVRLGDDRTLTNLGSVAKLRGDEFILTQKVGYRVIDTERIKIDGLAGFRFWHFGESLSFSNTSLNFSASQNWVDPLVGGRITGVLTPKVELVVAGDVGGWGAGSQLDYQIVGALGYRIKPNVSLQAGYRYLYVNYTNGPRFVELVTSGAMIGATINLK